MRDSIRKTLWDYSREAAHVYTVSFLAFSFPSELDLACHFVCRKLAKFSLLDSHEGGEKKPASQKIGLNLSDKNTLADTPILKPFQLKQWKSNGSLSLLANTLKHEKKYTRDV